MSLHLPRALLFTMALMLAHGSADAAPGKHLMWRVKSGANTVYLLGSIHAMQPSDYPLAPVIEKAFKNSQALVLEFDLTKLDSAKMRQMILTEGMYRHGKTLQDVLSKKTYQRAGDMAEGLGLKLARFNTMKPWLAGILILRIELKKAGYAARDGIDMHFAKRAARAHKPIIGLETAKYQMHLLANLAPAVQKKLLLQSLQQAGELKREMGQIVHAWSNGDAHKLAIIMHKDFRGFPSVYRRLIAKRNRRWLPKVEKLIARHKNYLIVVGALHLVGPDGLITRLRKDGYCVQQL